MVQSIASSGNTVVVTFRPDVNTVMTEKKGAFTLLVQFKDNITGEYQQRSLIVRVQDCMCGCIVKKSTCSWMTFMCYNMGADPNMSISEQMAYTPSTDYDSTVYGDWYQWGRKMDGHEKRSSGDCWPSACGTTASGPVSSWDSDGQVTIYLKVNIWYHLD